MEPVATIYSPRFSLRRSIPYVIAGVTVLSGGAFVGNYVGQQAAARSVAEADWAPQTERFSAVLRGNTLLRGPVVDQESIDERVDMADKNQDRIPEVRPVIGANRGDRRMKSDFLASLVPSTHVEDLLGSRTKALPGRLSKSNDRIGGAALPDQPMLSDAVPLPGEIIQDGLTDLANLSPDIGPETADDKEAQVPSPSVTKLSAMAQRGRKVKAKLATYLKRQRAEQVCLAKAIYFEARSEPTLGQIAVAGVVMNRVRSKRYPNSICGVVFQNDHKRNACQFSFACDGKTDVARSAKHWRSAMKLAKAFMDGRKKAHVIRNALFYHADYVSPDWARKMHVVKKIGRHIFYQANTRVASR